jgi:transcriptional regulator of nitric oxide reductase
MAVGTARCAVRTPTGRHEPLTTSGSPHPSEFRRLTHALGDGDGAARRSLPEEGRKSGQKERRDSYIRGGSFRRLTLALGDGDGAARRSLPEEGRESGQDGRRDSYIRGGSFRRLTLALGDGDGAARRSLPEERVLRRERGGGF